MGVIRESASCTASNNNMHQSEEPLMMPMFYLDASGKIRISNVPHKFAFWGAMFDLWCLSVCRPAASLAGAAGGDWHALPAEAQCVGLQSPLGLSALTTGWTPPEYLLRYSHYKDQKVSVFNPFFTFLDRGSQHFVSLLVWCSDPFWRDYKLFGYY